MHPSIQNWLFFRFLPWMAILTRLTGLFLAGPFFSGKTFPTTIKVPVVLVLSFITLSYVPEYIPIDIPVSEIVAIEMINFLYGVSAGLVANILFYGLLFAGDIFGYQVGFASANVFDPQSQTQSVIVAQLVYLTGMYVFTIIQGPMVLIGIFIESFGKVPASVVSFSRETSLNVSLVIGSVFELGIKVGIPLIVFMLLVTVTLGIMAKLLPQLNVFIVGIPLKILVGFLIIIGLLPILAETVVRYTQELGDWVSQTMNGF